MDNGTSALCVVTPLGFKPKTFRTGRGKAGICRQLRVRGLCAFCDFEL